MRPILPAILLLALPLAATAADPPPAPAPTELRIDPADDHTISAVGDATVIGITSRSGIGRTTIRSAGGSWPSPLIVRLHLSGLEHFEIGNGKISLATSVASSKPVVAQRTHVSPGAGAARLEVENQVPPEHPLYLHVRAVPSDKKEETIPLDGYFEIEVPQEFLKSKPDAISIRWIDFYR